MELCHIISQFEFPLNASIEEINNPDNLITLCPNHHKELDLGLLPDEDRQKIKNKKKQEKEQEWK